VAADPIAIAKLINTNKLGDRGLKRLGVSIKRRVLHLRVRGYRTFHSCQ
jgi:hypothetical protein